MQKLLKSDKNVRVETVAGAFSTPLRSLIRALLNYIGEDPSREGLLETPERVIKSYDELFSGYRFTDEKIAETLKVFEDGACDEMVVLKGIEFNSFCEHHMLPFIGIAHVAYVPSGKIVGISKLARLVDIYSKRLQVQERLTTQITAALDKHLMPKGSACVIEAKHQCMSCRGVGKQNSVMVTSSLTGVFKEEGTTRSEFLSLVRG
jgi:GTP cyclohydrolase I